MVLKKLIVIFALIIPNFSWAEDVEQQGCGDVYSYLVFDAKNANILSETQPGKITYPASLTKLMTLYLTFEALEIGKITPNQAIKISSRGEEISNVNSITTLHLKEGDQITVDQAIRGTIVKSFNEAAVSLAEVVAGSEWSFVRKMNEKALELGMFNSSFRNASGLHGEGQYTTSYDLARLVLALRKDFPKYYPLFSLTDFEFSGINYQTHNHVLVEYSGAEGLKTGFTNAAGYNLISAAKKSNQRVISVLLSCETFQSRDEFTKFLLDEGFSNLDGGSQIEISSKILPKFNYAKSKDPYVEEMHFGMLNHSF